MLPTDIMLVILLTVLSDVECQYGAEVVSNMRHCSPPTGSVDGSVVVEDSEGGIADLTTITWKIPLGSTLCYKYLQIV